MGVKRMRCKNCFLDASQYPAHKFRSVCCVILRETGGSQSFTRLEDWRGSLNSSTINNSLSNCFGQENVEQILMFSWKKHNF